MRIRLAAGVVLAMVVFAALGCGRASNKPRVVKVNVKVMFGKNTPAAGAFVVFHPTNPDLEKQIGGRPFGYVKDDGTVPITTYQEGDGAPEGEYGVTVVWEAKKDGKLGIEGGAVGSGDKLEGRYGNPNTPQLNVTVKAGQPNDFTLSVE
jgi:hypothetical protein